MVAERNYGRFYCLLKKLPGADKETLVSSFTNGRTVHLHKMSAKAVSYTHLVVERRSEECRFFPIPCL